MSPGERDFYDSGRPMFYDYDGRPLSLAEWSRLFEDRSSPDSMWQRTRRETEVAEGVTVSTVWIGLDHSLGGRVPLIYESMVFGGILDMECDRYPTLAAAHAGHEALVAQARIAEDLGPVPDDVEPPSSPTVAGEEGGS